MSRPESKNVFYFPHYTKSTSELDLIEHKYNSEGYKAYYRLQEMVADADYHRLSIKTEDEKARSIPAWYPNHVWSINPGFPI